MQARSAGVGEHVEHIVFWLGTIVGNLIYFGFFPLLLPFFFNCIVVVIHKSSSVASSLWGRLLNVINLSCKLCKWQMIVVPQLKSATQFCKIVVPQLVSKKSQFYF